MKQAGDVFFNELSLQPLGDQQEIQQHVLHYWEVLQKCCELGHKKVRYEYEFSALMISDNESLSDYCYKNFRNPELNNAINLILNTQCHPYIKDDSDQEKQFVEHEYQVIVDNNPCFGYGIVTAFLNDSFAIGFRANDTWGGFCFNMLVDNNHDTPKQVFCVSSLKHFEDPVFVNWYVGTFNVSYTKRVDKGILHLRDDHGKDRLEDLGNKILKEDFVIEVVNSLPFAPKASSFIEKIFDDGIIHLRLTSTDQGLGLVLRTVGKNVIQTTYFAKLLQEKYSC